MSNHDREGPPSPGRGRRALKRAWQQASDEQPPPELDAAIIAAARKSVQDRGAGGRSSPAARRSRNRLMQWQPLAAAATVAGLAFVLVQLLPRDRDVVPSIRMEEPARVEEPARGPATAEEKPSAIAPTAPPTAAEEKRGSTAPTTTVPQAAADEERGSGSTAPTTTVPQAAAEEQQGSAAPAASGPKATAEVPSTGATADGTTELHATEADQRGAVAPEMASPARRPRRQHRHGSGATAMRHHRAPRTGPQGSRRCTPRAMPPARRMHCANFVPRIRTQISTCRTRCATGPGR